MPWKIEFALKFSLHWNIFIFQGFWGTRACPENKVCHEICRYIQYTFHIQDVWATFDCPEKQSVLWIHCIECTFHHSEFWTTCPCPENRVCPENFHCIEYSFTFRIFEQLVLALKNSVPWIHCIEYIFFIIQNFEQPALALKNRICPEIFHCIEIFFMFQDFWATCACPENRVCPEFFKPGGGRPPPPRTPLCIFMVSIPTQWIEKGFFSVWNKYQTHTSVRDWWKKLKNHELICFHSKRTGNMENKNNSPVNIRFVAKTSDIRNFSENIRSKWQHWW